MKGVRDCCVAYPNQRKGDEDERVLKRLDKWLRQGVRANCGGYE